MGEHTEDILNGDVDQYTGAWKYYLELSDGTIRKFKFTDLRDIY